MKKLPPFLKEGDRMAVEGLRMTRIALTGNIASGKSAVQSILEEKGYKVLDTDEVSHKLLTVKNKELYAAFKDYDVFENGEFSRVKLGKIVFNDEKMRKKLEGVLHPQIADKIEEFFAKNSNENIIFVAIPLLFEAKMEYLFDKIIMVYTDDEIRLKRLMKRNNYTEQEAKIRMNSQISQDEKIKLCDYVIYNNGTINELAQSIFKQLGLNVDRQ